MPGLLLAEQIAGAADIEVVRGELESGRRSAWAVIFCCAGSVNSE